MAILTGNPTTRADIIDVITIVYTTDRPINDDWFTVDASSIPSFPDITEAGKQAKLRYNRKTKRMYIDIVDRELTSLEQKDDEIEQLKKLLSDATTMLVESGVL